MVAKTMTATAVDRFIRSMQDQGVGVTRTTKGLLLRLPNGETTTMHFTNSDVRAVDNLISRLRRAGVRHPDDPKDVRQLAASITEHPPVAERTKRKVIEALGKLGYPERVAVKQITDTVTANNMTVTAALYQMGFKPVRGKRNARDWMTPEDVLAMRPEPEPELEEQFVAAPESPTISEGSAEEAERLLGVALEGARKTGRDFAHLAGTKSEREFIDSVDSWVVDLRHLPRTMTIGDYLDSLAASGLEFEIRVWR